jgi:hypothetical protein
MYGGLIERLKLLLLSALLFGALGGMASYGYFFWKNKEMCPCATAGIEGAEGIVVEEPYSHERIVRRATTFGLVSAGLGLLVGLAALGPRTRWSPDDFME